MKRLITTLLLGLIFHFSHAQEAPEKANTVIISYTDSAGALSKVQKVLEDKGYTIKKSSKPTIITTEAKTLKNNSRISLAAESKGKDVLLTGNIVVVAQGNMRIENKGKKGTPLANAWEELDKVAKSLGGKISYEIK